MPTPFLAPDRTDPAMRFEVKRSEDEERGISAAPILGYLLTILRLLVGW